MTLWNRHLGCRTAFQTVLSAESVAGDAKLRCTGSIFFAFQMLMSLMSSSAIQASRSPRREAQRGA